MKILFSFCFLISSFTHSMEVAFINPTTKDDAFWSLTTQFIQEAAKDLNIQLTVYYAENYQIQSNLVKKIATSSDKPDYVIFMPYGGSIINSFNTLEEAAIPFVTLERVYGEEYRAQIQKPQELYRFWLGEMYYDNVKAGQILADKLILEAKYKVPNKELHVIGINGDNFMESKERALGLEKAINNSKNTILSQVATAYWDRNEASEKFINLYQRYGENEIVWVASDEMALGVLDAAKQMKLKPNQDLFIGGFDWIPEALDAIQKNKITASIGGHFIQGAWSLIKLYDHHNGIKTFIKGDNTAYIDMKIIDKTNVEKFKVLMNKVDFSKVDFAEFSLKHFSNKQPHLGYQLTIDNLLEKLSKR